MTRMPTHIARNGTVSKPATHKHRKQTKPQQQPQSLTIEDTSTSPLPETVKAKVHQIPDGTMVQLQPFTQIPTTSNPSGNRGRLCLQLAELQKQLTTFSNNHSILQEEFNRKTKILSKVEEDLQAEREKVSDIQAELTRVQTTPAAKVAKAKATLMLILHTFVMLLMQK